jgi:hypothetical protein
VPDPVISKEDPSSSSSSSLPAYDPTNPRVFMDIKNGSAEPKRVVFELFEKDVPKTTENFRCLCTGEKSTETD